tara:strand:- start:153 stop:434 length:282 start_codon:yes stop_codon:yes gene_type:complete
MTVTNTAKVLATECSPVMPNTAHGMMVTVEDDQVRYRDDGAAPTASEGHLLNDGDVLTFDSWTAPKSNWRQVLNAIQFIRVVGDAKLKISWYD